MEDRRLSRRRSQPRQLTGGLWNKESQTGFVAGRPTCLPRNIITSAFALCSVHDGAEVIGVVAETTREEKPCYAFISQAWRPR
jgi:hypothetical protein